MIDSQWFVSKQYIAHLLALVQDAFKGPSSPNTQWVIVQDQSKTCSLVAQYSANFLRNHFKFQSRERKTEVTKLQLNNFVVSSDPSNCGFEGMI